MTAEPTATSGLPRGTSSSAPNSATARNATTATIPHAAAHPAGRRTEVPGGSGSAAGAEEAEGVAVLTRAA